MNDGIINSEFKLPCGAVLKNRLVKSAMTERISNTHFEPTVGHERLYEDWSATGAGLLFTGNVMIDRKHLESAGNVVFNDEKIIPKLKRWADAGKKEGTHFWVQISHAGRQTNKFANTRPLAPSEVQLNKMGLFGKPKAMTEEDTHTFGARISAQPVFVANNQCTKRPVGWQSGKPKSAAADHPSEDPCCCRS